MINTIVKPKGFLHYTIVPTEILRAQGLSLAAVGFYCWLLSHDPKQKISISFCANFFKDGKDSIRNKLKELEKFNFIRLEKVRHNGRFQGYIYHVIDPNRGGLTAAVNPTQRKNININIKYNKETLEAYKHFEDLFPKRNRPANENQKNNWLDILDKVVRIDGYDLREVYKACKMFRENDFWKNNFMSLIKLRNIDRDGVKYIDRFMSAYGDTKKPVGYKKISGLENFYFVENKLYAKTKSGELNPYNLKQILTLNEINEIINYEKNNGKGTG